MNSKKNISVLLVEDNPGDIRLMKEYLKESAATSIKLNVAETLAAAVKYLSANSADAILLDLSLPDSQGLKTFHEINTRVQNIPIIILTDLEDKEFAFEVLQYGAQDYLSKNQINPELVARTIRYSVERKQAEIVLRQSEQQLKSYINNAGDAIYILNSKSGRILNCNERACHDLGYSMTELLKLSTSDIEANLPSEKINNINHSVNAGEVSTIEGMHKRKDKTIFPVEIRLSSLAPLQPELLIAMARDITDRKQAEEKFSESERRHKEIVNLTDAGYFFLDNKGYFRDVNPAWLRMHKFITAEEVIGKHFSFTQVETDLGAAKLNVEQMLKGEKNINGEFSRKCKDGSVAYHTFSANPVIKNGEIIGLEGFLIDTTEKKILEENEKIYNEQSKIILDSAIKYSQIGLDDNIADCISDHLYKLTNAKYIIVSSYNKQKNELVSESFRAEKEIVNQLTKLIGKPVVGLVHHPDEFVLNQLSTGNIVKVEGGLFEFAGGSLNKTISRSVEKLLGIHSIQVFGFTVNNELLGSAALLLGKGEKIENENLLKTFFHQTSVVIQKREKEKELKESEETYRMLFESINDAVYISELTDDGQASKFITVNDIACQRLGYTREELLSLSPYDIDSEKSKKGIPLTIKKLLGNTQIIHEAEHQAKDGKIIPVEISTKAFLFRGKTIIHSIARDITERKKIITALKISEEKYKAIFDNSIVGKSITEADGSMFVNKAFSKMLGYSIEELKKLKWQTITYPDDIKENKEIVDRLFSGVSDSASYTIRFIHKNGHIVWAEINTSVQKDNGKPLFLITSILDITKRKQDEELLKQSEEKLNAIYKAIPVPTYIWQKTSDDFILTSYNEAAKKISQGKIASFIRIKASEMYRNESNIIEALNKCINERITFEQEMQYTLHATNEPKYLNVKYAFVPPDQVLVHTEDITERKHMQDELRESEEKYRTFFQTNPDATFISTIDEGKIIAVNEGYIRMFGYTEAEIIGKSSLEFGIWVNPAERTPLVNKLKRDGKCENYEVLFYTKTGDILTTLLSTSVINLGGVQYVFSVAKDITKRKLTEEKLQESENKFRTIFNSHSAAIALIEKDATISMVNDAYVNLCGYSREEVIGKSWTRHVLPNDLERMHEYNQRRLISPDETPTEYEFSYYHKNGKIKQALISIGMMPNNSKIIASFIDITQRKLAEEELKNSEEKYRMLFEHSLFGIAHVRMISSNNKIVDYEYISVNPGFEKVTGLKNVVGKKVSEVIPGYCEENPESLKTFGRVAITGEAVYWEHHLTLLGRWFSFMVYKYANEEIVIVSDDITERKNAEFELQQSEAKFRNLIEFLPTTIYETDMMGNYTYVNTTGMEVFGYSKKDIEKGLNIKDVIVPEQKEQAFETLKQILNGKEININEYILRKKNGNKFPVYIKTMAIYKNNKPVGFRGIIIDISEIKKAQIKIKESEEKYRLLAENASDIVWTVDLETLKLTYISPAVEKIRGYTPEEAIKIPLDKTIAPDDYKIIMNELADALRPDSPLLLKLGDTRTYTFQEFHKNGSFITTETNLRFLRDEKMYPIGLIGVTRDITERRRAEKVLKASEEKYRLITEKISDVVWIMDLNGKSLFVSQSVKHFTGYAVEEYLAQTLSERFTPESAVIAMETFKKEVAYYMGSKVHPENYSKLVVLDYKCKDGSIKTGELLITPYLNENKICIGLHGVTRDITERKQSEEALLKSENKLSEAMQIAKLGTWDYDIKSDQFTFNDQFYSLFRTNAEREGGYIMSSGDYAGKFVYPDDMVILGAEIRKSMETTDPDYYSHIDHRIIYADGKMGFIAVHIRIEKDEQGNTVKTHGVNQDITDRKQAEELLKTSEQKFKTIFENIQDVYYESLFDGTILEISPSIEFISKGQYHRADLIGRSMFDFYNDLKDRDAII